MKHITAGIEANIETIPKLAMSVHGQLSSFDRLMYYWVAKDAYSGVGTIVDGGALVGATTTLLSEGLLANSAVTEKAERIHVYDLFQDQRDGYSAQVIKNWYGEKSNSDSIYDWEHIFHRNTKRYADLLKVRKGDIAAIGYADSQPIEVLSIDVAKSPELMLSIAKIFFPRLDPRKNLVLHQDYIFAFQPWLFIAMEMLEDYFEKTYDPPTNCTSIFTMKRQISESDIVRILGNSSTDFYKVENAKYINQAIEKADTIFGKIILTGSLSYFYLMMGKRSTAEHIALRLIDEYDLSQAFIERSDIGNLFNLQLGISYSHMMKTSDVAKGLLQGLGGRLRRLRRMLVS
jgi:hypothetical protein